MAGAGLWVGPGVGQSQSQVDAIQPVADLYSALRAAMRGSESFEQRFEQLAPVIDRDFDLNTILQTSVGLRWASLDEASRRDLLTVFRAFTIASYTANFDKDGGEKFEVLPRVRTSGSDVVVQSTLQPANGDPVRIDYVMRGGPTGWRIVDVLLNGSISRVAVQRSDFRSLLASGGTGPLVDSLRQKVAELSDGTMRP
jgi:phospholipid transport system substrate-binding protein